MDNPTFDMVWERSHALAKEVGKALVAEVEDESGNLNIPNLLALTTLTAANSFSAIVHAAAASGNVTLRAGKDTDQLQEQAVSALMDLAKEYLDFTTSGASNE